MTSTQVNIAILEQRLQQLLRTMGFDTYNSQPHPVLVEEYERVHRLLDREQQHLLR